MELKSTATESSISRSEVLSIAWKIVKTSSSNFSQAQKHAWKALRAKQALKKGVAKITFKKSNGELTTREATILPYTAKGTPKKRTSPKINFFSITDQAMRSFLPQNLISIQA